MKWKFYAMAAICLMVGATASAQNSRRIIKD